MDTKQLLGGMTLGTIAVGLFDKIKIKEKTMHNIEEDVFNGISFCITGKLDRYTRTKYHEWIEKNGGIVHTTVTHNTNILVTNYPDIATTKLSKAKSYGTKVINESDLLHMEEKYKVLKLISEL